MKAMRTAALVVLLVALVGASRAHAQTQALPELTQPVNDFAHVISPDRAGAMDRMIRALQAASGDAVVVVTVETFAPYGDIQEYANRLFENRGRGIGQKGKDNGVLITVAVNDRKAWIEVGYGLEEFITDGYAGETTRLYMIPEFKRNDYGAGLEAGVQRLVGRIAQARGISLEGVPREPERRRHTGPAAGNVVMALVFLAIIVFSIIGRLMRSGLVGGPRSGRGPWSGWNSGIGPFGGGWGGGFGGWGGGGFGGGGGGFGGFGGGASGGGGGGGSW
ncbi:MAG: TPM domain-containing protein [Bacteroidales bacterium]